MLLRRYIGWVKSRTNNLQEAISCLIGEGPKDKQMPTIHVSSHMVGKDSLEILAVHIFTSFALTYTCHSQSGDTNLANLKLT